MKKSIATLTLVFALHLTGSAQTPLYLQNFEAPAGEIFAQGWDSWDLHGSSQENYGIFSASPSIQAIGFTGKTFGGATFAMMGSAPVHNPDTDIAFWTEEYLLPTGTSQARFRVGSVGVGANTTSHYSVYVIESADLVQVANEAQLKTLLDGSTPALSETISGQSSLVTIDLSAFALTSVRLIYRLHDSATNTLFLLDDITVEASVLGNDGAVASAFSIYPNPASNRINISAANGNDITGLTLTDMNGRMVKAQTFQSVQQVQLELEELTSGIYHLNIKGMKGSTTQKIVKY